MPLQREIYNAPALAGQLIKFTLAENSEVVVTNKNLSGDPYSLTVMQFRKALGADDSVQNSDDSDFVELTPNIVFSNILNGVYLTKGNYALRVDSDASVTVWVNGSGGQVDVSTRIDEKLSLVLTQYRESPNLLGMMSAYLKQVIEVQDAIAEIPSKFDLDTAVGDQLTIIGRWLGFPRAHNVPSAVPVFGFECEGQTSQYNLAGFCEGALWLGCPGVSSFNVTIAEDELYRKFLYVRRYQLLGYNDYRTFVICIKILFGSAADYTQTGRIIDVSPGRALSDYEQTFLKVYERVLPCAVSASVNVNI